MNVRHTFHRVTLNSENRQGLQAWQLFVEHFNWKNLLSVKRWTTLDAAGALGFGAIFRNRWFNGSWPEQIAHLPITFKELFPIVLGMEIWGASLRNQCLIAHSDNLAVVHIIKRQTWKEASTMRLVRRLVLTCMKYNTFVKCVHISGKYNVLPDLLSRLQVDEFHRLAPEMDKDPTPVPPCLLEGIFWTFGNICWIIRLPSLHVNHTGAQFIFIPFFTTLFPPVTRVCFRIRLLNSLNSLLFSWLSTTNHQAYNPYYKDSPIFMLWTIGPAL